MTMHDLIPLLFLALHLIVPTSGSVVMMKNSKQKASLSGVLPATIVLRINARSTRALDYSEEVNAIVVTLK